MLRLGGPESAKILARVRLGVVTSAQVDIYAYECTPTPRRRGVGLNAEMTIFSPFHRKFILN